MAAIPPLHEEPDLPPGPMPDPSPGAQDPQPSEPAPRPGPQPDPSPSLPPDWSPVAPSPPGDAPP